ncbi:hypothetical protein ACHAWF_013484 [Thalassiosira exigua]
MSMTGMSPEAPAPMPGMDMDSSTTSTMPHMGTNGQFYYLFEELFVGSVGQMAGACVFTVAFAAALTVASRRLKRIARADGGKDEEGGPGVLVEIAAAFAFGADSFFHYVLMLLAMTFNIYILLSIAGGGALGHFVNLRLGRRERSTEADGANIAGEPSACH